VTRSVEASLSIQQQSHGTAISFALLFSKQQRAYGAIPCIQGFSYSNKRFNDVEKVMFYRHEKQKTFYHSRHTYIDDCLHCLLT